MSKASEAGTYFMLANDGNDWLVVGMDWIVEGIAVAGGDGWVAGRWDTRDAAVADAERWTQLAAAVSAS